MTRKALLASVAVFLRNTDPQLQASATLLVVCMSGAMHLSWQPYDFKMLDALETWSLVTCFVTFFLGVVLMSPEVSGGFRTLASVIVVGSNAGYVVYFAWMVGGRVVLKAKGGLGLVRDKVAQLRRKVGGGGSDPFTQRGSVEMMTFSVRISAEPAPAAQVNPLSRESL